MRDHLGLEKDTLLEEFVGQRALRLRGDQGDPRHRRRLVIQLPMLDQEMVVLSDGLPVLLGLGLTLDQRGEESTLDVARRGRAERIGLGDGKLLLGRAGDAALARAAVVNVVLILQGLPKLLLAAEEFDLARVVYLPTTVPHPRSVLAILLPDRLVNVVHRKPARRNMDIRFHHDLGSAGLLRLPLHHALGVIEQLGQAVVVTDHVVPDDRVHSRVHRQLRLLQEIGPPAGLARVGQTAVPGDMQLGLANPALCFQIAGMQEAAVSSSVAPATFGGKF